MDFLVEDLGKKSKVMSIFLDLSKAFDCVNLNSLLNKYDRLGIPGIPLMWFNSFSNN